MEEVILVDSFDRVLGQMEKIQTHQEGRLHRAFSVFIFNSKGGMLLQKRATGKYHSGGLWSNACCGHPRPGEEVAAAALRRLREEMRITASLTRLFPIVYMTPVGEHVFEYEYDHVFSGLSDETPEPDPDEVMEWKWIAPEALCADIDVHPLHYTIWFQLLYKAMLKAATTGIANLEG